MIRIAPMGRALAVVAATSLALTACGGGSDTAAPASPTAASSSSAAAPAAKGDGKLTIGTLLPQTGSLAFLGPPEFAGVDAGHQGDQRRRRRARQAVSKIDTDSGDTTTNIASQSVDSLLAQKADAIIGAASSSVSESVIDKITGAGVVHFSPANTSDKFTTIADKGLYFRTAPPDKLQGRVLGDLIVADGNDTVGILAMQDSYGTGLADQVAKTVQDGGAEVVERVDYDPKAADFSADVGQDQGEEPQGASCSSASRRPPRSSGELVKQGLPADKHKWYMVDGNTSNTNYIKMPKGTLKGVKGTIPGAAAPDEFQKKLLDGQPRPGGLQLRA